MIEWLFGDKKGEKKPEQKQQSKVDNSWAFQYVGQYLNSPLWRTPVLNFLENNCMIFQDTQENSFEYTTVFQKFRDLIAGLIDGMMKQVGISQELLEECIVNGLKTKRKRLFQQLLVCDNFLAFKRVMIKKNKQLEVEAMKQLAKEDSSFKVQQKKSALDLDRLEIEKAIALSKALASKLEQEEERMLQQALQQSALQEQKRQQKKSKNKGSEFQKLPPLNTHKPIAFGSSLLDEKPMEQLVKNRDQLIEESKKVKEEQQPAQDAQKRKKRLIQQRQLLKKKKQDQRKQQLQQFLAGQTVVQNKISQQQLQRRKNLAKKLKGQLGI